MQGNHILTGLKYGIPVKFRMQRKLLKLFRPSPHQGSAPVNLLVNTLVKVSVSKFKGNAINAAVSRMSDIK